MIICSRRAGAVLGRSVVNTPKYPPEAPDESCRLRAMTQIRFEDNGAPMGLGRLRDGLAPTPPMGWNSWNRFQTKIDERLIRETAEAMVETGMRDAGYRFVVIDDGWEAPQRDGDGDLVSDTERFGAGIADLARRMHDLELRFGIYTDAGSATCQGFPASLGNEARDARRFASWGVDYVKVDWCHTEGLRGRTQYAIWTDAFRRAGRPMVLSICEWGRDHPWEWGPEVGHLWRTSWDIQDTWASLIGVLDHQRGLARYAGPDAWNDPDMLEVGNGGMTLDEYRAHFSLWCVLAAPLMAGNDVRSMSPATREILTNREVIAVDQDSLGAQGMLVQEPGPELQVIAKRLADGSSAVVLLNRSALATPIGASWRRLGLHGAAAVRDLWAHADLGTFTGRFSATVPPHGVVMLRITPVKG
jgi:alpha-galactosidase